ncbi:MULTISPECIES: FAD-binding oxidoreductase [Pseudomonas]|uniref:FAD-binding oxidoreductase n=1 Tax=Pseudomonas petroselini TaxID=2899822 RepID=A0ABS8QPR2_9PSED|nr:MULTISPECIES: FAD-binding oxidoreductase [Pseudomonas]MCD7037655.1 FAD-binding oxidoreductase [Pseudomonas petroselini]MCD7046918.1 FAD-binding oxidoreductase [Pseudomonas petroselini]MCD7066536.1 FAD-binding oxidoreductase [Pseudomonas petroselini]MCD7080118.1 FAD-binding oxidoreductase [Pseudomonas petroselini]MCM2380417.1 FAD-binding oxidoreductase [Pseudomonas marginalis]
MQAINLTKAIDERTVRELQQLVGDENVSIQQDHRTQMSTDLSWLPRELCDIVVAPNSTEELIAIAKIAKVGGYCCVPRGAGLSYTRGYTPSRERSITIDMRRMNRILQINEEDMYITVECGCTWSAIYEALKEKGLRTPYYGPLSGLYSTVGGALSQNSIFMGSGTHGSTADSVIGLNVVLSDGSLLITGSGAHQNGAPFGRHFGPDITGIFTSDTGAMGLKATATFRLIVSPKSTRFASFSFDNLADMLGAQKEVARLRLASECYGFDPYYNKNFSKMEIPLSQKKAVGKQVIKEAGLLTALRMGMGGQRVLERVNYSLHMTIDSNTSQGASASLRVAKRICEKYNAKALTPSIPVLIRAVPFQPIRQYILGYGGECWFPIHGLVPLSKAIEVSLAIEAYFAENKARMDKNKIRYSYLMCSSGHEFLIEPSLYWPDKIDEFREEFLEPEYREKWKQRPEQPDVRAIALELRAGIRDIMFKNGGYHMQIGKYYPFKEALEGRGAPLWRLLNQIKDAVDPERKMNPGSLGLD